MNAMALACLSLLATSGQIPADELSPLPPWPAVQATVVNEFRQLPEFHPRDLITRRQAQLAIEKVAKLGWRVSDADKIVADMLDDGHIVPRSLLGSPQGRRFMQKTATYTLIYDRLDRTSQLPGGPQLIHDLVRLPNGEQYAKIRPAPGNPSLTELLPKGRSGRTPLPTDFDQPTGRIYTLEQLLTRLDENYRRDTAASAAAASP